MLDSLRRRALLVLVLVGSVILLTGSGVLSKRASVLVDDIAQLTGRLAAALTCFWTATRAAAGPVTWQLGT